MTMTVAEVQFLLSAPQAASGYVSPGTVYNSNGRWCSTTQLDLSVSANNLFPDLTGPQNAASQVDYQCVFVYNTDDNSTMSNVHAWIPVTSVVGSINWAVGADGVNEVATANTASGSPQADYITSPYVAPVSVTSWVSPQTLPSDGAILPDIAPGQVFPIWVRRSGTNGAGGTSSFNLQVTFEVS